MLLASELVCGREAIFWDFGRFDLATLLQLPHPEGLVFFFFFFVLAIIEMDQALQH